jgi:hypothetical protein
VLLAFAAPLLQAGAQHSQPSTPGEGPLSMIF